MADGLEAEVDVHLILLGAAKLMKCGISPWEYSFDTYRAIFY
jgi:hypothetical protein